MPSVADEDARRRDRELERLKRERLAHRCRIQSLLVAQGLRVSKVNGAISARLEALRLWDGSPLAQELTSELEREAQRLTLVERQIERLEATRRKRLCAPATAAEQQVVHLMRLEAIGPTSAWLLVMEFFGWRDIRNRRELAALAGLVGTPYNSGDSARDQGISKAGNRRVRAMIVQNRLAVVTLSTAERAQPVVPEPLCRWGPAHAPGGNRRPGAAAADRAVALPRRRRDARRRAAHRADAMTW